MKKFYRILLLSLSLVSLSFLSQQSFANDSCKQSCKEYSMRPKKIFAARIVAGLAQQVAFTLGVGYSFGTVDVTPKGLIVVSGLAGAFIGEAFHVLINIICVNCGDTSLEGRKEWIDAPEFYTRAGVRQLIYWTTAWSLLSYDPANVWYVPGLIIAGADLVSVGVRQLVKNRESVKESCEKTNKKCASWRESCWQKTKRAFSNLRDRCFGRALAEEAEEAPVAMDLDSDEEPQIVIAHENDEAEFSV